MRTIVQGSLSSRNFKASPPMACPSTISYESILWERALEPRTVEECCDPSSRLVQRDLLKDLEVFEDLAQAELLLEAACKRTRSQQFFPTWSLPTEEQMDKVAAARKLRDLQYSMDVIMSSNVLSKKHPRKMPGQHSTTPHACFPPHVCISHPTPHTHTHTHTHTITHRHTHTQARPHTCAHTHTHLHTQTQTQARARAHTHAHTYTLTHTLTPIPWGHTRVHTRAPTLTHLRRHTLSLVD